MMLVVNMVNSGLVAIVLASYSGQFWWLVFLGLTVALTAVCATGWGRYRHSGGAALSTAKWAMCATVGSGLSGLLWGVSSAFLLPDNLVEQTFVAFVVGGMCAASLVAFSNYLPAFVAYVFPASLPLVGRFFLDGWTVHGDMMVVFAAAITLAAYNSTRDFVKGLRLNCDLVEKTRELTAANQRLQTEIDQRRVAEDQLRQAHKMEAVGQLTGGIAHDFNNLLTVVVGHLEMAQSRVSDDPRAVALLQVASRAAERGAALTRHLLAFARRLPRAEGELINRVENNPDQFYIEPRQAKILVCDDDSGVLGFVGTTLRDHGYTVWEAATPVRALEIIESGRPLDLLLVDYAMPEMNGMAVIGRARAAQQGLKVLLMSGHADVLRSGGSLGIPLLAKPFKVAELRRRIAEVLAVRSPVLGAQDRGPRRFAVTA
jgi:CheY-like chemotaxis protein